VNLALVGMQQDAAVSDLFGYLKNQWSAGAIVRC
jgi:hypothetical protein